MSIIATVQFVLNNFFLIAFSVNIHIALLRLHGHGSYMVVLTDVGFELRITGFAVVVWF